VKLLFIVNTTDFFISHRLPLALAARDKGYDVHIATGSGDNCEKISSLGFEYHFIPISRSGLNLWGELTTIWLFFQLIRSLKPDLLHLVTIKPVMYGGLIARLTRVPAVVVAISGLGSIFVPFAQNRKLKFFRYGVEFLYKFVLRHPNLKAVFQNPNDKELITRLGALQGEQSVLVRGSGVFLKDYPFRAEPRGVPVITFASRLLKEKGVNEFVDAARILKNKGVNIRFWLVGAPDNGNPSSIQQVDVDLWQKEGLVEYLGFRSDISDIFADSNLIVLPSYYGEGLPKVLIEAAACGRAVVTTDSPGCRDAIIPNVSGLLIPVRDSIKLAEAILGLVNDQDLRAAMGKTGRCLAEQEFRIENIVDAHLKVYSDLTGMH
jgi:glycosyltransferase involved in cell wall biosynthesis